MANSSSLTTEATAIHFHHDTEFAHSIGSLQRMFNHMAMLDARESFLIGLIIDNYLPLAGEKPGLGYSTLAFTRSPNVTFLAHKSSPFL
jgi:hypothetical protein